MREDRSELPLLPDKLARAVSTVVLHCSATPSGQYLRGAAPVVIDHWHEVRHFRRTLKARAAFNPDLSAIGYHFVVDLDGKIWTGRHLEEVGAHAYGHNAHSAGICLVGGAEPKAAYTVSQWESLAWLVPAVSQLCGGVRVVGHRDLAPARTCPGFCVATWLQRGMEPLLEHVAPAPRGAL